MISIYRFNARSLIKTIIYIKKSHRTVTHYQQMTTYYHTVAITIPYYNNVNQRTKRFYDILSQWQSAHEAFLAILYDDTLIVLAHLLSSEIIALRG